MGEWEREVDEGRVKRESGRKRLEKGGEMTGLRRAKPGRDRRKESMRQPEKDR